MAQASSHSSRCSRAEWRPVTPAEIGTLAPFYEDLERPLADLNPAMMAAWADTLRLRYCIVEDVLYVLGVFNEQTVLWGPPLGEALGMKHVDFGLDLSQSAGGKPTILYTWDGYPLLARLQRSKRHAVTAQASEYIYDVDSLAGLSDRPRRKLRQSANRFARRWQPTSLRFEPPLAQPCIDLLERWLAVKRQVVAPENRIKMELEASVCQRALQQGLKLEGVLVQVADRIEAFSLGVAHGPSTFNCMFEKANPRLPGCAAFVFRELARILKGSFTEINAGEDWNVGYLARTKRKWGPSRIQRSYKVSLDH